MMMMASSLSLSFNLNSTHLLFTPPLSWRKKMESIATSKPTTTTITMVGGGRRRSSKHIGGVKVNAFFLNPSDQRILKQALEEPVAFMGGMFAGLLRLDLSEDPLKEWVTRTVEASGITEAEIDAPDSETEESPQQIEIE